MLELHGAQYSRTILYNPVQYKLYKIVQKGMHNLHPGDNFDANGITARARTLKVKHLDFGLNIPIKMYSLSL